LDPSYLDYLAKTNLNPLGIEIVKAEGSYLYGPKEERYLDFISGIAVSNIGHRHPEVIEAIKHQANRYLHVMAYGEYIQDVQVELARRLSDLLPENLDCVYLTNSGTEANEGALKLAKRITGKSKIVSCYNSYHGSTHGSLSVTGNENKKYAFRPLLPDIHFINFNDPNDLETIDSKTACVIMEPIQGDAGVRIPDKEYLQQVRKKCTETGALLIFDEVQTGFGRTGKMFAFEHFEVIPDILTLAKAMGAGLPIGGFISSMENMSTLTHDPQLGHLTTFGGNPLSCAAAIANLKVFEDENLVDYCEAKGKIFEKKLENPRIIGFRRKGLMMALELENKETVEKVVNNCIQSGVICFWFLSNAESLRIAPPLTISEAEIEDGCSMIVQALDKV